MYNVHNLTVGFGGTALFEEISFRLQAGDKVGLIGKNGAGKSTMLKLLSGEMPADGGQLARDKDVRVGFLKQDIEFEAGRTILEEASLAFEEIKLLEAQMEETNQLLADRQDHESAEYYQLMVDVSELGQRYEMLGGYNYQGQIEKILLGLGFKREEFGNLTDTFSGGWRMRIELAKLLLQNNDVLLLDEPTNHLDIESIIWLEGFLKDYQGVVVIVSHDKMFLDNVTNRTIELVNKRIYDQKKAYSDFMLYREEVRLLQANQLKNQEKEIQRTEQLIEKFRAKASKASMAQSLIKKLDKMERVELDDVENVSMTMDFPISRDPGKVVVEAKGISKSYGDKQVLRNIDLLIPRGTKVAFVGQNGQGKTTLAKIIAGELEHCGQFELGHNVELGYFAQNQAEYLDQSQTVEDTLLNDSHGKTSSEIRKILGSFLFSGDEVYKQVKVLSGGERNRLALAKLMLKPFNVLIMDEPTNHLDIKSKNVLKEAMVRFKGTLLLVSHDRDFLMGLTDKVYEFKNGRVKEFLGDIKEYLEERELEDFRQLSLSKDDKETVQKKKNNLDHKQQKEVRSLKNKVGKLEKEIAILEKKLADWDHQLLMDYDTTAADPSFFDKYNETKNILAQNMANWEEAQEKLDALGS